MHTKDRSQVNKLLWLINYRYYLPNLNKSLPATLTIRQGRITTSPQVSVELIPVVGIATVELGGSAASRPTYYFDCITDLNNGSGIRWTRMSIQLRFDVESIPDGSLGKRLNVGGLDFPDLDIYTCSDQYSDDVASINITACEYWYMFNDITSFSIDLH